ncbi:MAG: 1-acyl-sn-glycerol-3-phosphate acyltransferase [Anaerolineae bacterium]|nr:1-acyl-sn-glycerol-3-phosphate acyltransferase [Anaerolineae bacterium]
MVNTAITYPRRRAIRSILKLGINVALRVFADVQIIGKEHFPKTGPLLMIGNHFSFLDPVVFIGLAPYPMEFVGGPTTPNAPGWAEPFRKAYGIVQIRRGASSREGLLEAESVLKNNGVLGIFPEGGSWATVLRPPRPGVALLAVRTPARIRPIGLEGLNDVLPFAKQGKRAKVTIRVGEPFGPFSIKDRSVSLREQMDEIGHEMMRRVSALIPPEQRGFYSEDPAIREAAKGTEIYPWEFVSE